MNGEDLQALIRSIAEIPPATLAQAKAVMDAAEKNKRGDRQACPAR